MYQLWVSVCVPNLYGTKLEHQDNAPGHSGLGQGRSVPKAYPDFEGSGV